MDMDTPDPEEDYYYDDTDDSQSGDEYDDEGYAMDDEVYVQDDDEELETRRVPVASTSSSKQRAPKPRKDSRPTEPAIPPSTAPDNQVSVSRLAIRTSTVSEQEILDSWLTNEHLIPDRPSF